MIDLLRAPGYLLPVCMLAWGATVAGCSTTNNASGLSFDPANHKGPSAGRPNEVLVLGSPHLSGINASIGDEELEPILDRLTRWRPDAIAIEAVSGAQCDYMRRYSFRYAQTVADYCVDNGPALNALGIADAPAAIAEIESRLKDWPAEPSPSERRRLSALFLAAGERASALVQWLRLADDERRAGDGLNDALVAELEAISKKRNESYQIGAKLAARLGLERVYAMDDHTADGPVDDEEAFGAAMMSAWNNEAGTKRKALDESYESRVKEPNMLLEYYRFLNSAESEILAFQNDFGAALEEPSPQGFGRSYLSFWETRNLRMAGNIREVAGMRHGSRTLVIVGASHKGYLDAYLNEMHDLRVASVSEALR